MFVFKIDLVSLGRSYGIPKWHSLLCDERTPRFPRESQHSISRGVKTNEVVPLRLLNHVLTDW